MRKAALFLLSVVALLVSDAEMVFGQSAIDGFDPNANGVVRVIVVQPDGKILLGGSFTTLSPNGGVAVARNRIARLNPDGTIDTAFNPDADGEVRSIAVQADGKILVGGGFHSIGGQARSLIARLDAATGLADSFDPNASGPGGGTVYSIAVQADGRILAAGSFTSIGGQARNNIGRLDPTTGLADSFDPDARDFILSIAVQADGKILVVGGFNGTNSIGGQARDRIARLDPTTGLADSFDPKANLLVWTVAVQADGKVLVGGDFHSVGGQPRNRIARLDAATGLPDSFNPDPENAVHSIAVQADGKILAGGLFSIVGGRGRKGIARLDPTSGLADSFDPNAQTNADVYAIAVQADGKVLVGGQFATLAPNGGAAVARQCIARLESDGTLDQTIDPSIPGGAVIATAVQPDGKILISGGFSTVLGVPRNAMARLNRDGTLDAAFDPDMDSAAQSIVVQADGKILVGGAFTRIGGETRNRIARLDPTTGAADSFDPNANDQLYSIAVQADGRILAAGAFTRIGGETRHRIARLDPATGLADSFDPNANFIVQSIAVEADGKILAGGGFTTIGGRARNYMARLDATTGQADLFDPHPDETVYSFAVQADGKILLGGIFSSVGGEPRNRIARLDPTTGLPDSFDPNANNQVQSIVVQADGKVLAGGFFSSVGGQFRGGIARLDPVTGQPDSFNPNANNAVYSIAVQADGKVLAGGFFTSIGGYPRDFARLSNDTAALQNLAVARTTVTWMRGGSSPDLTRVTFESSPDNVIYTPLGNGTAAGNNWILTGLSLPTGENLYVRARGYYRGGYVGGSESITESVRRAFVTPGAQALNLSTRMFVQTGDKVGIAGFIITGTAPKHVLLRGLGPSAAHGFRDVLDDPVLELHGPGSFATVTNNNWRDTQEEEIEATGLPPTHDLESAIDATLTPGAYTAVLRGANQSTGSALVEIYDLGQAAPAKLANISTRAFVGTDEDIVIAGFILGGNSGDDRIVVRGIGPSLTVLGVPDALANPRLELREHNGTLVVANDDWQDNPAQAAEISAAGLALGHQLEAGIAVTLPPGPYTALLFGVNNGTGLGLVEVYDRGAP